MVEKTLRPVSIAMLEQLIAFDTTSRHSNLQLIEFIRSYLADLGVTAELVYNAERSKANLYATLGPQDRPGIALSGHTDVVPVDGQDWASDPFVLTERDDRLYGRGSADMKAFIAICLALTPEILKQELRTPVHFMFSYDEEIGCIGVRTLLEVLKDRPVKPLACIVGEPTLMKIIRAHKGKLSMRCRVRGFSCHSSLAHQGVNAVEAAAETVAYLKSMARRFRDNGPYDADLEPSYTTVHTGVLQGGTALNIVPAESHFDFEFRHLPEQDPQALFAELQAFTEQQLLPEMQAVAADSGFSWEQLSQFPGLSTADDADVVELVKALTGANSTGKVSFGTEAGLFQAIDIPTVVCGPGSIEQAHKPDEFIAIGEIVRCEEFIRRLIGRLAAQ
jgi:acetylornithine deacetylase